MSILSLIGIAIALSLDALTVSMANGCMIYELKHKQAFIISFSFGLFQAIMPLIGWGTGTLFTVYIKQYDHWVAFILLSGVSLKMLHEAYTAPDGSVKSCLDPRVLIIMSIATSIDALAIGISFSVLHIAIIKPIIIIGVITFFICLGGIYIANRLGNILGKRFEYAGAFILFIIGSKILIEHLVKGI